MKHFLLLSLMLVAISRELNAQSPQFAVVKPNGTTQIFPSWTAAYNAAVNDDYIYLPGAGITGTISINKRLHIFGAGHHPDSTSATARTIFTGSITVGGGASNGSIQGIVLNDNIFIGDDISKLTNYQVFRCFIAGVIYFSAYNQDSLSEYITIRENIFASSVYSTNSPGAKNLLFEKNIIYGQINWLTFSAFRNNIFLYTGSPVFLNTTNTLFENNIFNMHSPAIPSYGNCFNSFLNNIKPTFPQFEENQDCPVLLQSNNMSVNSIDSIFISYIPNGNYYDDNFHISPDCPCIDAGTDGTDLGIYGTNDPTSEGWVPSNPHIYFKDIAPSTGADGKLHIEVGVRANNN